MPSDHADMFPADHYEAIGRLALACTRLDAVMTDLICRFSGMTPTCGLITVHHQQFAHKVETLKALMEASDAFYGEPPSELRDLITKAKELYDYRSRLVHDAWIVGSAGSPSTEKITARGKLRRDRKHRPTREIRAFAAEAVELADALEALQDSLL